MGFIAFANSKIKKLDMWDVGCIKFGCMFFALMVAKLWKPILNLDWYWYLIIWVVIVIRPLYRAYFKKSS